MADWAIIYAAVLFGLVLLITICKGLIVWQMDRSPLSICSFAVFAALQFLYLVTAAHWPLWWRDVARGVFLLALVGDNVFCWRALIVFLANKNARITDAATLAATAGTLGEIGATGADVALDATKKPIVK